MKLYFAPYFLVCLWASIEPYNVMDYMSLIGVGINNIFVTFFHLGLIHEFDIQSFD
jgi:hypothetical protein